MLRKLKDKWPKLGMYIQYSPISVLFGFIFGYLIFTFQGGDVAIKLRKSFEPLFMNFFLPFIIIDGAVNAFPKRGFFKNIVPVLCFAVLGTGIAIITTGLLFRLVIWMGVIQKVCVESIRNSPPCSALYSLVWSQQLILLQCCLFLKRSKSVDCNGSLISLYSIVYGESMLNDVIGYTTFQALIDKNLTEGGTQTTTKILLELFWIGMSVLLGYGIGLLVALLCRIGGDNEVRNDSSVNIDNTLYSTDFGVMFLSPWIAYLIAETFDLSAILTIFFCGLALGQYAIHNLSPGCRTFTAKTYGAISEICESISFIYIGVSFYGFNVKSEYHSITKGRETVQLVLSGRHYARFILFTRPERVPLFDSHRQVPKEEDQALLQVHDVVLWAQRCHE